MQTLFMLVVLAVSSSAFAYSGRSSQQAILEYRATLDVDHTPASIDETHRLIRKQIDHLSGLFQSESFQEHENFTAALSSLDPRDNEIQITLESTTPKKTGGVRIRYAFKGRLVVGKAAFRTAGERKKGRDVSVVLPRNLETVYAAGIVRKRDKIYNACTDYDFNGEAEFYYFWDPDKDGCPLQNDNQIVQRLTGHLQPLGNTRYTYPEYNRLYGDNGNGKKLEIAIFLGYIAYPPNPSKINRYDDAYRGMREIELYLSQNGFMRTSMQNAFAENEEGFSTPGNNSLRLYENADTRIMILLSDTDLGNKDDRTFARHIPAAIESADILVYDGHSGLESAAIDLDQLPEVQMNPHKYQLFLLNGCSTYQTFKGQFFRAKGGSKNMDIITAGLPTFSNATGPNTIAFLEGFLQRKTPSYQSILAKIEDSVSQPAPSLMGVSGDEDNRWVP